MILRLRVVSEQRRSLGDRSRIELVAAGATIGRSADNDWVLPDPLRYVSAHHGRISFSDGHYFFEDASTNGSYVNDEEQPLGDLYRLRNGDLLRLGEYHIVVALEAEPGMPKADHTGSATNGVPTSISALRTVGHVTDMDIGAPLDVHELLEAPEFLQSSAPRPTANAESFLGDDPSDSAIARRIARLAKAAQRNPRDNAARNGAPRDGAALAADAQSGLQAFCRGAGVDLDSVPAEAQPRLLHLVGQLLREALVGLKDLDRARDETRARFRIEITAEPDDPRPSLTRLSVEDLLIALFNQHQMRSIDAVQWLRESLSAGKEHEHGVAQAMRTAFVEFLDRLDPAELEARFERAARRGNPKSADRAQYWELYTEFYRSLIEMPADHLPHTFVEAFARCYREGWKK
jgi:type VI secretion system protein